MIGTSRDELHTMSDTLNTRTTIGRQDIQAMEQPVVARQAVSVYSTLLTGVIVIEHISHHNCRYRERVGSVLPATKTAVRSAWPFSDYALTLFVIARFTVQ